jgi:hypothetical protein
MDLVFASPGSRESSSMASSSWGYFCPLFRIYFMYGLRFEPYSPSMLSKVRIEASVVIPLGEDYCRKPDDGRRRAVQTRQASRQLARNSYLLCENKESVLSSRLFPVCGSSPNPKSPSNEPPPAATNDSRNPCEPVTGTLLTNQFNCHHEHLFSSIQSRSRLGPTRHSTHVVDCQSLGGQEYPRHMSRIHGKAGS